jgi:hypothetical protein
MLWVGVVWTGLGWLVDVERAAMVWLGRARTGVSTRGGMEWQDGARLVDMRRDDVARPGRVRIVDVGWRGKAG